MKRVISLVMALLLVCSIVPIAFADLSDNTFQVYFNDSGDYPITMQVNGSSPTKLTAIDSPYSFESGTQIRFQVATYSDFLEAKVTVLSDSSITYYSTTTSTERLVVSGTELTFTPDTNNPFTISIWRTQQERDYEELTAQDDEIAVTFFGVADGFVSFTNVAPIASATSGNDTKYIFASNTSSIAVELAPPSGKHIESIFANGAGIGLSDDGDFASFTLEDFESPENKNIGIDVSYFYNVYIRINNPENVSTEILLNNEQYHYDNDTYCIRVDSDNSIGENIIPFRVRFDSEHPKGIKSFTINGIIKTDVLTGAFNDGNGYKQMDGYYYYGINLEEYPDNTDISVNLELTSETSLSSDYLAAKRVIESRDYAYYGSDTDILNYLASEIYYENFNEGRPFAGMFTSVTDAKESIKKLEGSSTSLSCRGEPLNGNYYEITLGTSTELGTVTSIVPVYQLTSSKQFIVVTSDEDTVNLDYQVVDTSSLIEEKVDLYVYSTSTNTAFLVFGNGVTAIGSLESSTGDYSAAHITQEHSGLSTGTTISGLGCRLAVFPKDFKGIRAVGSIKPAAWGFISIPIFSTSGDETEPSICQVYFGNDGSDENHKFFVTTAKDDAGSSSLFHLATITNIEVNTKQIIGDVASITPDSGGFNIQFHTGYDVIPMVVTYSDGSKGYVEMQRVGMKITDSGKDTENQSFNIWHSTDHTSSYTQLNNATHNITASFYYNTGSNTPTQHISLFVTIVTTSGTEHHVVQRLNGNYIQTNSGEGGTPYCDDFLLWSGTDEEYRDLLSVSAIAYEDSGDDETFGGVQVGSGAGVLWENEEANVQ